MWTCSPLARRDDVEWPNQKPYSSSKYGGVKNAHMLAREFAARCNAFNLAACGQSRFALGLRAIGTSDARDDPLGCPSGASQVHDWKNVRAVFRGGGVQGASWAVLESLFGACLGHVPLLWQRPGRRFACGLRTKILPFSMRLITKKRIRASRSWNGSPFITPKQWGADMDGRHGDRGHVPRN